MKLKTSNVFHWTNNAYRDGNHWQIVNYGGTRSGKTWQTLQLFLILLVTIPKLKITCWRNIRAVCRATIMQDFLEIISDDFNIMRQFVRNKNDGSWVNKRNGSQIIFEGCDSEAKVHGLKQDISFFNEITEMAEGVYDQITQRTSQMVFADYNPSKRFWFDKYQKNPNTIYFKSTFLDNPFLTKQIINKVLSYDPSNPLNVKYGTANEFMWKCYGLGDVAEKPNRVYDTFAMCTDQYYEMLDYDEYYGLDFGTIVPTAVVAVKFDGDKTFFLKQLLYKPSKEFGCSTGEYLKKYVTEIGEEDLLVCDSAKESMVTDLQNDGFNAVKAKKGPGSFDRGIEVMQGFTIVATVSSEAIHEENSVYEYDVDRYGLVTDKVIRKNDHILDSARYIVTYLKVMLGINV